MELLIAAFIFYFVIKHAVRKAILEAKSEEMDLGFKNKINNLMDEITEYGNKLILNTTSADLKEQVRGINIDCIEISMSDKSDQEKYSSLKKAENEMVMLKSAKSVYE